MSLADVLYEPAAPEGTRHPHAPPPGERDLPSKPQDRADPGDLREPTVPETPAEEQYYAAVQKANQQAERQAQRVSGRDEILRFLETPLGRDFRAVAELARRGKVAEARDYVLKLLDALSEQSFRVQAYALRMAVQIFRAQKDFGGLKQVIRRYLELLRRRMGDTRQLSRVERDSADETVRSAEKLLSELERLK